MRRRFFPSRRVQRVPGQQVALEVQLRPEAPVPAPADECVCDVAGARWLWSLGPGDAGWQEEPDGTWLRSGSSLFMSSASIWHGTPDRFDRAGTPLEGPGFRCVHIDIAYELGTPGVFVGVIQGQALCDAGWDLAWEHASGADPALSSRGHRAVAAGNMVYVYPAINNGNSDEEDTLVARAQCSGQVVGEISMRLVFTPY